MELLSPAGNLEKMKTALAFGADAVYTGIPEFSLRTRVNDFNLTKIKQATKYCHNLNKKIYVTLNIIAHNYHFKKLEKHILELKKIGIDALIISDPGIISFAKKIWPDCVIHLSTQANCINWASAQFWFSIGVKRVVLGREASIKDIIEIHKKVPKLELECFVHGAMCMAYSGRCFLSKYFVDKSANLGDCVQPCRWEYRVKSQKSKVQSQENTFFVNSSLGQDPRASSLEVKEMTGAKTPASSLSLKAKGYDDKVLEIVEEEHGSYILNSKDLCLIKKINELIQAGVTSFKIEGRAKSVYYLANIIGAYKSAIDLSSNSKIGAKTKSLPRTTIRDKKIDSLYKELETKLFTRGYTQGFTFGNGKMAQDLNRSHTQCEWEFCGQVISMSNVQFPIINNKKNEKLIPVRVHNSLKIGDRIEIVKPYYDIVKFKLDSIFDAKTGKELQEAHGGQEKIVFIEVKNSDIPEYSVIRRKIIY